MKGGQIKRLFVFLMLVGSVAGAIMVRNGIRTLENTRGKIERTVSSGVTTGIQYKHSGVTTDLADIAAVNALTLSAGDTIAFPKGETFYGQINISQSGSSSHPIVITSFGSGAKPIISGAIQTLGTWVARGNYYACKTGDAVYNLLCNGVPQTPAKYPNTGFYRITDSISNNVLYSTGLVQPTNYWQGCSARVRDQHGFTYSTRSITSFAGDSIVLSLEPRYPPKVGYSFTIDLAGSVDGPLAELDQSGEWYYNSANDTLYFWAPGSVNPSTLNIEAATQNYGLKDSTHSYIIVNGLEFRATRYTAIYFTGASSNITIQNCNVRGAYGDGIATGYGPVSSLVVDADSVSDCSGNGISIYRTGTVSNCVVQRIALQKGLGSESPESNEQAHMAIGILIGTQSDTNVTGTVTNCRVDSTGYTGIYAPTVTNSYVTNVLLTLYDGGAVYFYCPNDASGNSRPYFDHNIVDGVYGDTLGANAVSAAANAYYIDGFSRNARVTNNFAANVNDAGIFLQYYSKFDTVAHNTIYNANSSSGLLGSIYVGCDTNTVRHPAYILDADTILVFDKVHNYALRFSGYVGPEGLWATSNHNVFLKTNLPDAVVLWNPGSFDYYTLAQWVVASHQDSLSTEMVYDTSTYLINPTGSPLTVSPAVSKAWQTLAGTYVGSSVTIPAHSSLVLITM